MSDIYKREKCQLRLDTYFCILMIVNERRKWYDTKEFKFSGGEENGSILTIKKYLSTWNCVK